MSFLNKKITLSASNLFSISVINRVLSYICGEEMFTHSNLSIKSSKHQKRGFHIEAISEVIPNQTKILWDSIEIKLNFYLEKEMSEKWNLSSIFPSVSVTFGLPTKTFKLRFKEDNSIAAWNDVEIIKMKELTRHFSKAN